MLLCPKISQRCSPFIPRADSMAAMAWWDGKGSWRGERDWEKWEKWEKGNGKHSQKGSKGQKGQKGKGKGKEGKDGERKGKGWRKEEWFPQEEARSQLSSEAADFIPSGLYDYDVLSHQYWDMDEEPTWREFADHEGTKYYYNCKTGLTQWERPAELDLPKPQEPQEHHSSPEKGKMGKAGKAKGYGGYQAQGEQGAPARKSEKGEKGEGKARKGKDGKDGGKGKKERSKDKDDATFGPQGCNLFVFHLPDEWGDEDMVEYFSPHGKIVSAKVMKELGTGRSRGFGFVSYEAQADAATAIRKMQGYKILGKRLKVEFKKGETTEEPKEKAPSADDERLIGYLRAISAQSVVQSLKSTESKVEPVHSVDHVESVEDPPEPEPRQLQAARDRTANPDGNQLQPQQRWSR
eukprot:s893_g19.t1